MFYLVACAATAGASFVLMTLSIRDSYAGQAALNAGLFVQSVWLARAYVRKLKGKAQ